MANLPSKKNCYSETLVAGCNKKGYITTWELQKTPTGFRFQGSLLPSIKICDFITRKKIFIFMSLFHHSTPADGQLRFFLSPSPQTYLNNANILSTLFGISDWLSALQFARASIHLVEKLGDRRVPLLFAGDENTTSLFSCFVYAKKNTSVVWLTRKNQKKNTAKKRFWLWQTPLLASKKSALGFHSWRMLNLSKRSQGNGNFLGGSLFPQLKEKYMHVHQSQ